MILLIYSYGLVVISSNYLCIFHRKNVICDTNTPLAPERCSQREACATILTSEESEACILADVVRNHRLYAVVRPLGDRLPEVANALKSPLIICDWAPEFSDLTNLTTTTLGPPPCEPPQTCPFETRRIVAYVNNKFLKQSAINALAQYKVSREEIRNLTRTAIATTPENAAAVHWKLHPWKTYGAVRMIVMVPGLTNRHVYSGALPGAAGIRADLIDGIVFKSHVR